MPTIVCRFVGKSTLENWNFSFGRFAMKTPLPRWTTRSLFLCALLAFDLPSLHAVEPFDYFQNSWNVIGLKDYSDGTRITPDNELLLAGGDKVQIKFGKELTPLSRKQTKTLYEGWMPIVLLSAQDGAVRYDFTLWATPLPTVKDWQKAFDWPTEGENFLNWVKLKVTNTGADRAVATFAFKVAGTTRETSWGLEPGETVETCKRLPFAPCPEANSWDSESSTVWFDRTAEYWRNALAAGAKIDVPCRKAADALKAAHVCQLIANDHGEIRGGEGFYDEFYIRDGAYQIMQYEEGGLNDVAQKAVASFLAFQKPDGRFESQDNELDGNGQAIWALWQYAKINGDRAFLEKVYPQMMKACRWTMKTRRLAPADSPFAGLLPAAFADGEFLYDRKHHIVGYDLWNLRGLLCAADAAKTLGKDAEAKELLAEADDYRKAIDAAVKRAGVDYFPASWEKDGTFWGNTETLWPTPLFAADDPRVIGTIHQARKVLGGGFTEGTIHWVGLPEDAIHPYMAAYTTLASLDRGEDEQVVEDFYWYLHHSTAAHAFPEGIHYKRQFAWGDTIPHGTGASNYAILLRHLLVHEQGGDLRLLPAVPDWWLGAGQEIKIENAPTHFGPISLVVRGTPAGVEVQLTKPARNPPASIVLHLPASRPLVGTLSGVEVVSRPDQKTRWDFPTIVKTYQDQKAAPPAK
jgi:hypothetical protein